MALTPEQEVVRAERLAELSPQRRRDLKRMKTLLGNAPGTVDTRAKKLAWLLADVSNVRPQTSEEIFKRAEVLVNDPANVDAFDAANLVERTVTQSRAKRAGVRVIPEKLLINQAEAI